MAEYGLATPDPSGPVFRYADGAYIPDDPANRDWMEYQKWLAAGNVPDPYVPPPDPVPVVDDPVQDVILLDHENRLRAIEGLDPMPKEEFKTWMRTLS